MGFCFQPLRMYFGWLAMDMAAAAAAPLLPSLSPSASPSSYSSSSCVCCCCFSSSSSSSAGGLRDRFRQRFRFQVIENSGYNRSIAVSTRAGRGVVDVASVAWMPPLLLLSSRSACLVVVRSASELAAVDLRESFSFCGLRGRRRRCRGRGRSLAVGGVCWNRDSRQAIHLFWSSPASFFVGRGVSNFALSAAVKPILYGNGQDEKEEPPTFVSAPDRRIVAIGDLHGDFERTLWALQLAGVLSKDGLYRWTGGTTVLVQVGDVLDRGEDEIAILSLLAWLGKQARSNGGGVFQINGNHETMNVAGDFHHVTPGGFKEAEAFVDCCEEDYGGNWEATFGEWYATSQEKKADEGFNFGNWLPIFNYLRLQKGVAARSLLFEAGGPMAKQLARHGVALKVNDWLFAHGGIMPLHVEYGLEKMNHEVSLWMKNANNCWSQPAQIPFFAIKGYDSIVWSRLYSHERHENPEEKPCATLSAALVAAKARGLVVGHTPQTIGANCKCDGRVWRIDVGMSSGVLHALPEVLEITDTEVRVLRMAEEFLREDDGAAVDWMV